jgi:hypothetical protein
MNSAQWKDVWDLLVRLIAHQAPTVQIAIVLGLAFGALMIVEGLRANFWPRAKAPPPPRAAPAQGIVIPEPQAPVLRSVRTFAAKPVERNPKRRETTISRHCALRPTIRRRGTVNTPQDNDPDSTAPPAIYGHVLPQVSGFDT